jgi:integrase
MPGFLADPAWSRDWHGGVMSESVASFAQGREEAPENVPAKLEKTRTPGIYKRGGRYVVVYYVEGRQRRESAPNYELARKLKAAREADTARGEFHAESRLTFRAYAAEWVERYQGRGRGFRESTRDNYRSDLARYAFRYFGERKRLSEIARRDIANFIGWLCDEMAQARHDDALRMEAGLKPKSRPAKRLSDSSVANILKPVRACLGTAVAEGLIRQNPARDVATPHRPTVQSEETEEARALSRAQLATFLTVVHPKHRTLFRFLASTGLRVSELAALQWRDVRLDGGRPHVRVRRQLYRGRLQPPKSRHGRRDVPLDHDLVIALRAGRASAQWGGDEHLVFANEAGGPLDKDNLRRRHLRPAAEEAGAPWAAFHTFRHTCASLLFERGASIVQVQRWLGHHSAAFTLSTYVHWLDGEDLGEPLALDEEVGAATWPPLSLPTSPPLAA